MQKKVRLFFFILYSGIGFNSFSQIPDTTYINHLNEQSFKLIKKFPDSAVDLAQKAIALSEKINYNVGLGDGYIRLGLVEKDKGNYNDALTFYRKSLQHRMRVGNQDLVARVYNNMGMAFTWQAKYDSAIHYLMLALQLAEKLQLKSYQATYLMNLGIAHENNKDYHNAIGYYQQAMKFYIEEEDSVGIMKTLINQGLLYHSIDDFQKSLELSRKAFELAAAIDDERNKLNAIGNIAVSYQGLHQFDSALYYMRQSLDYKKKIGDNRGVAIDMSNFGFIFSALGKKDSAVYYLAESLRITEEIGEIKLASKNAEELANVYSSAGDYKNAFTYHEKFAAYRDSVFNESKEEAIAEMQTKYETEKKEKEIQLLNKDNEIKTLTIKKQNSFRNSLVAGIILILVITALLFNRYRNSQQQKRQEERMRISHDLHDEVGSTLSSIGLYSAYAGQQLSENKSDDAINILEEISSSSQEMIDDMNDIIWAINPRNDSFEHIVSRLRSYSSRMAQSKGIMLNFQVSELLNGISMNMDHRKNLFLICKEAINNSVKYSCCKNLFINLDKNKKHLVVEVSDDGKGFEANNSYEGNGLKNMKTRSEQIQANFSIQSVAGSGTKIQVEMKIV